MDVETENIKKIYFKGYKSLLLLENAIKHLRKTGPADFRITIIGKVTHFCHEKNIDVLKNREQLEIYWSGILGVYNNLGTFVNSEIGNIFIAGTLASTFLREINGNSLGTFSSGPYAIIRGMGASEIQATDFYKVLDEGNYLAIFRGSENEMKNYEKILIDT